MLHRHPLPCLRIVLYVPSATILTSGGYFLKRPDTEQYDTIISAQQLLKGMLDAHQDDLAQLQQQRPADGSSSSSSSSSGGGTLLDLVKKGLSADDDAVTAVDCALALLSELVLASEQRRVLLAVDDYNALYWRTGYGTSVPGSAAGRRELKVEELRLASSMRLLARKDLGNAAVVAAVGDSIGVPAHVTEQVVQAAGEKLVVPRYSFTEVAHAVAWYHEAGMAAEVPSESQVKKLMMLTSGNGREVRRMAARTSLLDVNQL
jgi:small subunit ribosomal protein S29